MKEDVEMGKLTKSWRESSKKLEAVMRAIRVNCADCAGSTEAERRYCSSLDCPLWPYRFGEAQVDPRLLDKANFQEGGLFDINLDVEELTKREKPEQSANDREFGDLTDPQSTSPCSSASK
jgi:hypothetical protein